MKTLAISIGDINGIGPEISLKAVCKHQWPKDLRFVFIGHKEIITRQLHKLGLEPPSSEIWQPSNISSLEWTPGKISATASTAAIQWVESAVIGCLEKRFDAMVTAPICKAGLQKANIKIPGHTEYLAQLTNTKNFGMLLVGGSLRVLLVTRHIPLRKVATELQTTQIFSTIELAAKALPWLGIPNGCIGVCGLNPHAGDSGVLGSEEQTIITPAIKNARNQSINVEGPVPPDVIFHQAHQGKYDMVIAMYHDQGLAPLKMLAFDKGINLTLGLPIIRTSPDHGTAFDIAGKGIANPASMIAAIKTAYHLTKRRNPWNRI